MSAAGTATSAHWRPSLVSPRASRTVGKSNGRDTRRTVESETLSPRNKAPSARKVRNDCAAVSTCGSSFRRRQQVQRFGADMHRIANRKLLMLDSGESLADLRVAPGNGWRRSAAIEPAAQNLGVDQWRICFTWTPADRRMSIHRLPLKGLRGCHPNCWAARDINRDAK